MGSPDIYDSPTASDHKPEAKSNNGLWLITIIHSRAALMFFENTFTLIDAQSPISNSRP